MAANATSYRRKILTPDMRDLFHVPSRYFLSHSVGCLPRATQSVLEQDFFEPWRTGSNWFKWMDKIDQFRSGIARILSVTPDMICPQSNISSALTKIIYSHEPSSSRNRIVLSRQAFPTIGFVVKQAERAGYEMCFVDGDVTDPANWARVINGQTAFVHITHALSNTSHILPVKTICDLAKQANALSIVDAAQSSGIVKIDPVDWGADFVLGTGVKFLCFGPGACFLYAAKHVIPECQPIDVGWFSHENPFEMDIGSFRYAQDAMRFFGGTPSPAPLIAANAAMEIWDEIGFETLGLSIASRLDILCASLSEDVLISPREALARGGTCVVNPKDRGPLRAALISDKFLFDERMDGFRFSVHGYTSIEDCEALANLFKTLT